MHHVVVRHGWVTSVRDVVLVTLFLHLCGANLFAIRWLCSHDLALNFFKFRPISCTTSPTRTVRVGWCGDLEEYRCRIVHEFLIIRIVVQKRVTASFCSLAASNSVLRIYAEDYRLSMPNVLLRQYCLEPTRVLLELWTILFKLLAWGSSPLWNTAVDNGCPSCKISPVPQVNTNSLFLLRMSISLDLNLCAWISDGGIVCRSSVSIVKKITSPTFPCVQGVF